MLARRCFLRRIASQSGTDALWGGRRAGMVPCKKVTMEVFGEDEGDVRL
jgi:hypothetical protein